MHHHHHRRRKKRINYGIRTVQIARGLNGFGFTISGQKPCILSQIVSGSPADIAGLRPGDFLISVNGLNVSKLPHESVVQLIGNSFGTIRMQIAENYFSDSSDEENLQTNHMRQNRVKPSYLHHKLKVNRLRNSPQKGRLPIAFSESSFLLGGFINSNDMGDSTNHVEMLHPVIEDLSESAVPVIGPSVVFSPKASTSHDIANCSAMVKIESLSDSSEVTSSLEYRVIVGYLGTIEMPKQIAINSKLQTVRSCIRKLRQEKRNPTIVLMRILPNCLTLKNSNAKILATYPSSRLNYVSSSSESENRFFGLVTSAIYANIDEEAGRYDARDVIISNSCHVFVIDPKICDHSTHEQRAFDFQIGCTKDPISNLCLEFPSNSEYVVNLIRSMYTMKVLPPAIRKARQNIDLQAARSAPSDPQANSPQPSNHSEVTTISSNSDSGIHGFHNDCANISDRILVVDFPGLMRSRLSGGPRPIGIRGEIEAAAINNDTKSKLTVRAMPDPKFPDLLVNFCLTKNTALITRSCDDVIASVERDEYVTLKKPIQMSMDDISMLSGNGSKTEQEEEKEHIFVAPNKPISKKTKKSNESGDELIKELKEKICHKLSPKVFGMIGAKQFSTSFENLSRRKSGNFELNGCSAKKNSMNDFENWGSLQELNKINKSCIDDNGGANNLNNFLDGTYSEPDLGTRALPSTSSPFRRWGQSSFRGPKTQTEQKSKRPSSLAASDNDVYSKSMDDLVSNGNPSILQRSGSSITTVNCDEQNNPSSVESWGSSFERLLEDPAGLHTFSEFLKKEFSAENIYFWTSCERYRLEENDSDRTTKALEIFKKHLANGATDPVNVDSQARGITEENLSKADRNLFFYAQKQVFNLMKFDSYQRFIRSDLYKKCLEAEQRNHPLPYPGELLDESLKIGHLNSPGPSKLKKSVSNAEDRRRKSLLPWHRKARCKSRDRSDSTNSLTKSQSTGNALKLPITAGSDLHGSRSSLSSFDAQQPKETVESCSLCRVILCDGGATTVCQCRPDETIRQLIERLLEKRLIDYKCFDVMLNGTTKPIDLSSPATTLAGKEVLVEHRVTFKLDLPDPKVISVKSKPRKVLCDVLKPILEKYNYRFEDVEILMRDTHEKLNLNLSVTVADGQRLQVVMLTKSSVIRNGVQVYPHNTQFPKNIIKKASNTTVDTQQSTLDEITNKVFNELLQGKVESHRTSGELNSIKSDDCASETSSIFERYKRHDSNNLDLRKPKTNEVLQGSQSDDALSITTRKASDPGVKKPLIAKWKTGVKLQVPGVRVQNQDEFLEGLKKAQQARLEDQRGTEINSELPDFLKNKANVAIKMRRLREKLNPVIKYGEIETNQRNSIDSPERPQPAPRLSISKSASSTTIINGSSTSISSPTESIDKSILNSSTSSNEYENLFRGPPPLPPKPKVLPIKPSNWGQNSSSNTLTISSKIPTRNTYLDQPSCSSSSFV